jgi:hypothetical protein
MGRRAGTTTIHIVFVWFGLTCQSFVIKMSGDNRSAQRGERACQGHPSRIRR